MLADTLKLILALPPLTFVPAFILFRWRGARFKSLYELLVFSAITGLCGVNLVYFAFRFLHLSERFFFYPLIILETAGLVYLGRAHKLAVEDWRVSRDELVKTFLPWALLTGVLLFFFIRAPFTGLQYNEDGSMRFGLGVYSDLFWYPGVSAHLKYHFPPQLQIFAGVRLKYHYFGPLFIAHLGNITHIENLRLYFHYLMFPLIPLLTGAVFYTVRGFVRKNVVALVSLLFFLFQEFGKNFYLSPTTTLAFLLVAAFFYFLNRFVRDKKTIYLILAGFLLGNVVMYEAFFALLLLPVMGIAGLVGFFVQGKKHLLIAGIVSIVAAGTLYVAACGTKGGGDGKFPLNFEMPFYKHSVQTYKNFANQHKEWRRDFREKGRAFKAIYEVERFFIHVFFLTVHYVAYLGIGILGLASLWRNLVRLWKLSAEQSVLSLSVAVALLFPLLIGWREWRDLTFRTLTFGIPFLMIYAGPKVIDWFRRGLAGRFVASSCVALFVIFPLYQREINPEKIRKARAFYSWISPSEVEAFRFVREKTPHDAVVPHPFIDDEIHDERGPNVVAWTFKDHYYYMTGLGERMTLAEGSFAVIYAKAPVSKEEIETRRRDIAEFYRTSDEEKAEDILSTYPIDYVWEEAAKPIRFNKRGLLEKVFENDAVVLYRNLVRKIS